MQTFASRVGFAYSRHATIRPFLPSNVKFCLLAPSTCRQKIRPIKIPGGEPNVIRPEVRGPPGSPPPAPVALLLPFTRVSAAGLPHQFPSCPSRQAPAPPSVQRCPRVHVGPRSSPDGDRAGSVGPGSVGSGWAGPGPWACPALPVALAVRASSARPSPRRAARWPCAQACGPSSSDLTFVGVLVPGGRPVAGRDVSSWRPVADGNDDTPPRTCRAGCGVGRGVGRLACVRRGQHAGYRLPRLVR